MSLAVAPLLPNTQFAEPVMVYKLAENNANDLKQCVKFKSPRLLCGFP